MMDGILNINKPLGITSFDVVRNIKSILKMKKVGHTGTLDPGATGVLPICIGRATKLVDYIMDGHKIYIAELKFGISTDTYDKYGKIIYNHDVELDEGRVLNTIDKFVGCIEQVPPMYSAIKVNGKRLYELARKGIEVKRKSRNIFIYNINLLDMNLPYMKFEVECSKGTYIRSLCHDMGKELGCGAVMWSLERTYTGGFAIEDSVCLGNLNENNIGDYLIPMDDALYKYPKIFITDAFKKQVLNGIIIKNNEFLRKIHEEILYRVYVDSDKFIGIGSNIKNTGFKMIKLLIRGN